MKTLSYDQMESVSGSKFLACLGQVSTGIEVLGSVAFLLSFSNPIGWGLLIFGGIGLIATTAADPHACD